VQPAEADTAVHALRVQQRKCSDEVIVQAARLVSDAGGADLLQELLSFSESSLVGALGVGVEVAVRALRVTVEVAPDQDALG
jgi:hypothetical protein